MSGHDAVRIAKIARIRKQDRLLRKIQGPRMQLQPRTRKTKRLLHCAFNQAVQRLFHRARLGPVVATERPQMLRLMELDRLAGG